MSLLAKLFRTRTSRIAAVALIILTWDQLTKAAVLRNIPYGAERMAVPGFLKLVHWQNTGAAWSLFTGNNTILAIVAVAALVILFLGRHQFDSRSWLGQIALGMIFGGITGNLIDRIHVGHVIDFIYVYVIEFPAFNIADSGICVGVVLMFLLSWRNENSKSAQQPN